MALALQESLYTVLEEMALIRILEVRDKTAAKGRKALRHIQYTTLCVWGSNMSIILYILHMLCVKQEPKTCK
jgi:hypothetical protein